MSWHFLNEALEQMAQHSRAPISRTEILAGWNSAGGLSPFIHPILGDHSSTTRASRAATKAPYRISLQTTENL
jgi:hypothetical protein